jgi:hypothetical protein
MNTGSSTSRVFYSQNDALGTVGSALTPVTLTIGTPQAVAARRS